MAHKRGNVIYYRFLKYGIVRPLFFTYFRGQLYGEENLPHTSRVIIASNHASYLDIPLLGCVMREPVAFMAKEELFEHPVSRRIMNWGGGFPVDRESPKPSTMRSALKILDLGWSVGVFLGGTRTPDERIYDPKLGMALIAAKAQVPILPVCLWGTRAILECSRFPQPTPITVRVAPPLDPPPKGDREAMKTVTAKCAETINSLHELGR